jgi:hypothetical protein
VAKVLVLAAGSLTTMLSAAVQMTGREPMLSFSYSDALLKTAHTYSAAAIIDTSAGNDCWKLAERLKDMRRPGKMPLLLISEKPLGEAEVDRALAVGARAVLTGIVSVEQVAAELASVLAQL